MAGLNWMFLSLIVGGFVTQLSQSYPILLQVDEGSERCFQFQIPSGDDAHLVGVIIPSEDDVQDERVESWFFEQVYKLTASKKDKKIIPKKFPDDVPDYVSTQMSEFTKELTGTALSPVIVSLTNRPTDRKGENQYHSRYFMPMVVNYIARITNARANRKGMVPDEEIEGYGICIKNRDENSQIQFIMDIVLVSEDIPTDLQGNEGFSKERHLTPLEQSLEESIASGEQILKEMKYMEQRERRMRVTTDNINSRVRWFSYLSISILLAVTYIQVSYLKRYFHKKKLM